MDWQRRPGEDPRDPAGVGRVLDRARETLGGTALSGERFVHDARRMLDKTRQIEAQALGAAPVLYVGFQDADRLDEVADLYDRIGDHGTKVVAYGVEQPRRLPAGLEWIQVADRPLALENQWFLVSPEPWPLGLVGYETSAEPQRRTGGTRSPARTFEGFYTRDPRLVGALVDHLERVRARDER